MGSGENRGNQHLPEDVVEEIARRSCHTQAPDPPLAYGKIYPPKGSDRYTSLKKYTAGAVLGGSALLGGAYLLGGKPGTSTKK